MTTLLKKIVKKRPIRLLLSICIVAISLTSPQALSAEDLFEDVYTRSGEEAGLSKAEQYFYKVAFGAEHGSKDEKIKKWAKEIRIKITKNASYEDKETINKVIHELNQLLEGKPQILITKNDDFNTKIDFVTKGSFKRFLPNSTHRTNGFVSVWFNHRSEIVEAKVFIAKNLHYSKRAHVIREELTQSLGILKDSYDYKNSIFYEGNSRTTSFSKEDKAVIKTLYRKDIKPGMSKEEVLSILL